MWLAAFVAAATTVEAAAQINLPLRLKPAGPPPEVKVTDRGTVRMHVADVELSTVLHLLSLEGQRNIVASPAVTGTVTANLYDVTFEEALEAVLIPNGAGYRVDGKFVYVYTAKELEELAAANAPPPESRVYRLNYITGTDAQSYLSPLVGEKGHISVPPRPTTGLKSAAEEGGGDASAAQEFVIVTAGTKVHDRVAAVLREIDVRPSQVLVEATILRAELTDDNALGVDFSLVGGVDLELLGAQSTGIAGVTLGQLPTDRFERFNGAATTDITGNVPDGGLTLGIIKDNVAVFLRALEEVTDTSVLANPKVLALNRQKAQVIVGRRDGFFTTTVTETQAIQTVEFLETGTQLIFRPFIGDDGFVRVELHPEDSVGFVNAQGLPSEQTTEVTTNVIVRDGETILIGGLFREVTTDARRQVPGLGSLPGLGVLFRSQSDTTAREEVIILLTLHVIKDRDAYAEVSHRQFEDLERLRVGIRDGLMWHGRERLSQADYRKATAALENGRVDKALWYLNMALYNQPRLLPAIELKEQLLGRRAWDEDGVSMRGFLDAVRHHGAATPPARFGRPRSSLEENDPPPPEQTREDGTAGT